MHSVMKRGYFAQFNQLFKSLGLILALSVLAACAQDAKQTNAPQEEDQATEELMQLSFESHRDGSVRELTRATKPSHSTEFSFRLSSGQSLNLQNKEFSLSHFNQLHFSQNGSEWNLEALEANGGRLKVSQRREVLNLSLLSKLESAPNHTLQEGATFYVLSLTKESFIRAQVKILAMSQQGIEINYKVFEDSAIHALELDQLVLSDQQIQTVEVSSLNADETIYLPIDTEDSSFGNLPLGFNLRFSGDGEMQILATDAWFPGQSGVFELPYQSSLERLSEAEHFAYSGSFKGSRRIKLDAVYLLRLENLHERVLLAMSFYKDSEGRILMQYKTQAIYN